MNLKLRSLAGLALAVLCIALQIPAQTSRGTVSGLVTDASGAVVSGASVELLNVATGVTRRSQTTESGLYRFDAVDLGSYDLSVALAGFSTYRKRLIPVSAGSVVTVDAVLEVGETTTTVEVESSAVVLQSEAPVRGGNLDSKQVAELPISVRNPANLALNLPGVSTNRFGRGEGSYSVNGARGRSNNFLLDGTENNDISVAGQGFQLRNPDAVAEVNVQTSNFDAEFGRSGGAVVNVITKSGTNQLHGTAGLMLDVTNDDAVTNTQALSEEVQDRGKPLPGTEQWWSGTLGGPIFLPKWYDGRNRSFFFVSFLERRQRSDSQGNVRIPSAAGLNTLNSLFPAGSNANVDLFRSTLANAGTANSQFFPVELGDGRPNVEFGTRIFPYSQTRKDRQWLFRGDHKLGENDQLSLRYASSDESLPVGGQTDGLPGFFTSQQNKYYNALISETHVFSPVLTNELRASYNRIGLDFPIDPTNGLGLTMPQLTIAGINTGSSAYTLGVSSTFPQGRIANNYVIQDTMSWIRGRHTLRFGFDLLEQRSKQFAPIPLRGRLTFNASTGRQGFANFVDNYGGSGGGADRTFGDAAYYPELFRQAYFFQDRWRMTDSVTLTLGIRYENFGNPINSLQTAAWAGLFNIDPVTFDGPYRLPSKVKDDNNNFSPTLGLAWSPGFQSGILGKVFGEKKSVVRAGYGIGYDSFYNNIASNAQTSVPNVIATAIPSQVNTANPRGLANLSGQIPVSPRAPQPIDSQALVPGDLVNPYIQRWSVGVQRELPWNSLLDLSYVGSQGTKLFINEQLNPTVPSSLQINTSPNPAPFALQPRWDRLQGSRNIRTNGGNSNYHAFQALLTKRLSSGLSGTVSYSFSKLIDNGSDVFSITGVGQTQNPAVPAAFTSNGLRFDRAISVLDRPNRAVFALIYELPWMKTQQGLVGRVLGGWQVSTVTSIESGVPINIQNGLDADGLDGAGDRPDFNPNGQRGVRAVLSASSPTGYVNPDNGRAPIDPRDAMFIQLPANSGSGIGRTGNLGRNTWRSPGLRNVDVSLFKRVSIKEGMQMEFRTDMFNLPNHPQYGYPSVSAFSPPEQGIGSNVGTTADGQFLRPEFADGGGRVIRYELKFRF